MKVRNNLDDFYCSLFEVCLKGLRVVSLKHVLMNLKKPLQLSKVFLLNIFQHAIYAH